MAEIESFQASSRIDATFLWNHAQLESLEKKLDQSVLSSRELQSISLQLNALREQALATGAKGSTVGSGLVRDANQPTTLSGPAVMTLHM